MRQELANANDYLKSLTEENGVVTDELKLANNEANSSNEELRCTNEELQTAKEEVLSANWPPPHARERRGRSSAG